MNVYKGLVVYKQTQAFTHTQIPTLNKHCNQSLLKALQKKIDQQITNKQINIQV